MKVPDNTSSIRGPVPTPPSSEGPSKTSQTRSSTITKISTTIKAQISAIGKSFSTLSKAKEISAKSSPPSKEDAKAVSNAAQQSNTFPQLLKKHHHKIPDFQSKGYTPLPNDLFDEAQSGYSASPLSQQQEAGPKGYVDLPQTQEADSSGYSASPLSQQQEAGPKGYVDLPQTQEADSSGYSASPLAQSPASVKIDEGPSDVSSTTPVPMPTTEGLKNDARAIGKMALARLAENPKLAEEMKLNGSVTVNGPQDITMTLVQAKSRNPLKKEPLYALLGKNEGGKLGKGTFKDVQLAIEIKGKNKMSPVAIATPRDSANLKETKAEFKHEHKLSTKLRKKFGKNIFASKRLTTLNGKLSLVMPTIEGDYKARDEDSKVRKLSNDQLIENTTDVLNTIIEMAQAGYVNADIKDDNVFIDKQGTAMIADWGLAGSKEELEARKDPETMKRLSAQLREIENKLGDSAFDQDEVVEQQKKLGADIADREEGFESKVKRSVLSWAQCAVRSFPINALSDNDLRTTIEKQFNDSLKKLNIENTEIYIEYNTKNEVWDAINKR